VTRAEVDEAIGRVLWRHRRVDDPRRSGLGTEPREVLEHLTRHSVGLPQWAAAADTLDALVLTTWLWWEDRRRERALLRRGLHLGLTHTELGVPLGITTRQGLRDRLDRLDALLAYHRPDEQLTREARREARASDPRQAWLDAHRGLVQEVLSTLLDQADRLDTQGDPHGDNSGDNSEPAEEDWLGELRADLAADRLTPATLSMLGLALGPLRITVHQAGLAPGHGLHRAIRAADAVRGDLARATGTPPAVASHARHSDEHPR
jgi:hypothetical protein